MLRKLILLIISAIFLAGCGASAPPETVLDANSSLSPLAEYGTTEAAADGVPFLAAETIPAAGEEKQVSEAPEYFLFTNSTNTVTDGDDLSILYERRAAATFSSPDAGRSEWVRSVLDSMANSFELNSMNLYTYANDFIEANGSEYFYSYSNYQQLGVARHDETVVSLIELSSLYSGGSHPNSVQTAYNLDIENRRLLQLEDIIEESAAPELAALVHQAVNEKFAVLNGGSGLFDDYADTIDNSMAYGSMTPYWYLNDTGLVVFYNQYELGPYAAGIIKAEISYSSLEGILAEEYYPAEPAEEAGDLVLDAATMGKRTIPITIEAEGETLRIGVEGRVYQVQLSEILWLESTPIAQELLFSALSLGEDDVLEITGGYDNAERSFAIEFLNGAGEQVLYYLHEGELTAEP